jgi:hypothetical protein
LEGGAKFCPNCGKAVTAKALKAPSTAGKGPPTLPPVALGVELWNGIHAGMNRAMAEKRITEILQVQSAQDLMAYTTPSTEIGLFASGEYDRDPYGNETGFSYSGPTWLDYRPYSPEDPLIRPWIRITDLFSHRSKGSSDCGLELDTLRVFNPQITNPYEWVEASFFRGKLVAVATGLSLEIVKWPDWWDKMHEQFGKENHDYTTAWFWEKKDKTISFEQPEGWVPSKKSRLSLDRSYPFMRYADHKNIKKFIAETEAARQKAAANITL